MARNRNKERESGKEKESNAIKEYLTAKHNNMEQMAASKLEENINTSRMADLEYRSAYFRNWMQLSNGSVSHELLSSVLPPLPDSITVPHAMVPNNIACHSHFSLHSRQQKKKKKKHIKRPESDALAAAGVVVPARKGGWRVAAVTAVTAVTVPFSSDSSDSSTSAAMVKNITKTKTKTKKKRESY